ncbi:MAG: universal stress protein [Methanomicrobiales archaeon]
MFTNILVAIDGSEVSDRALARAVDEARIWNAKIHAVYVVEMGLFSSLPTDNTVEIIYRVLEKEGHEKLAQAKAIAATQGLALTTHLKQGHAGTEILAVAGKEKIDLVVVGSHGKSNVDKLLIGSVSSFVVSHGKTATLVVRS